MENQILVDQISVEGTDEEIIKAFFSILGGRFPRIQSVTWKNGDKAVLSILIKQGKSRLYFDFYFKNKKLISIFFQEYLKEQ